MAAESTSRYRRRDVLRVTTAAAATSVGVTCARGATVDTPDGGGSVPVPIGRATMVEPDPDVGFHHPYVLYEPERGYETPRPLFLHPLNDVAVSTDEERRSHLREAVRSDLFGIARDLGLPGLVPGFPRTPNDGGDRVQSLSLPTHRSETTLERLATDAFPAESLRRVDRQTVAMLEDARERLTGTYPLTDRVHMTGFSSSAQFAARFAFLYPDRVDAISVGGNGAYPLPRASLGGTRLPYPLGTADYRAVTGREFDRETWTETAQYVYVGRQDQPLPETDERGYYPVSYRDRETAVAVFGRNRVTERLPVTESVYREAGADPTVRVYDGVRHTIDRKMVRDVREFHRENASLPDGDATGVWRLALPAAATLASLGVLGAGLYLVGRLSGDDV
jgi:pimeloyl-ACP methyl ester carboxylesterase